MKEDVSFDEWDKLDLRVGTIDEVDDIAGADKLYKLTVDLGEEKRILVAGLKNHYSKNALEGEQCIVFNNLKPRMLKGIESRGMVLACSDLDKGKVVLLQPSKKMPNGSRVS